jgi:hypothetical protein
MPAPSARETSLLPYTDGQLELLKWIALASMFVDHFGRHLLGWPQDSWVFGAGRIAFPLFALVLGLNLARPGDQAARAARTAARLALWCAIALVPSVSARGEPMTVNVLGTLALGSALCWAIASGEALVLRIAACLAIAAASDHVEFGLQGVFLVAAVYLWRAGPRMEGAILAALLFMAVAWLNARFGGLYGLLGTLACLPVAWSAARVPAQVPRLQRAFYIVYPLHLGIIGLLKRAG